MKYANTGLLNALADWSSASGDYVADLLTITLQSGTIVRLTNAATPITIVSYAAPTLVQGESHTAPAPASFAGVTCCAIVATHATIWFQNRGLWDATQQVWLSPTQYTGGALTTNQYFWEASTGTYYIDPGLTGHSIQLNYTWVANTPVTFAAGGVSFERSKVKTAIGLQADDMTLTLMIPTGATLGGFTWPRACTLGLLDYAQVVVERSYQQTWNPQASAANPTVIFSGYMGEMRPSRSTITCPVHPITAILATQMPRRTYQPGCLHVLYDPGCTLLVASYTTTGTVGNSATTQSIPTGLTAADHYYELGQIIFTGNTTAALTGIGRTVQTYLNSGGTVTVTPPLPAAPTDTDTFSIYPGCDKQQSTCTTKFSNLAHFAGFPYVPVQEAML